MLGWLPMRLPHPQLSSPRLSPQDLPITVGDLDGSDPPRKDFASQAPSKVNSINPADGYQVPVNAAPPCGGSRRSRPWSIQPFRAQARIRYRPEASDPRDTSGLPSTAPW